jgi:hypothetical protein
MQSLVEIHDTSLRLRYGTPPLGVVWIDQLVPFQRSAKGTVLPALFT